MCDFSSVSPSIFQKLCLCWLSPCRLYSDWGNLENTTEPEKAFIKPVPLHHAYLKCYACSLTAVHSSTTTCANIRKSLTNYSPFLSTASIHQRKPSRNLVTYLKTKTFRDGSGFMFVQNRFVPQRENTWAILTHLLLKKTSPSSQTVYCSTSLENLAWKSRLPLLPLVNTGQKN